MKQGVTSIPILPISGICPENVSSRILTALPEGRVKPRCDMESLTIMFNGLCCVSFTPGIRERVMDYMML